MDESLDTLATLCWGLTFLSPFIVLLLVWRNSKAPVWRKLLYTVLIALPVSLLFAYLTFAIAFRNGMGP